MYATLTMLWLALADPTAGTARRRRPAFRRPAQRPLTRRLELELLESRNVLSTLTAGGLKLGPLVQVTAGLPGYSLSDEVEPYLAVNPTNPKNMVGTWTQDAFPGARAPAAGIGVAVTFNGGNTWKTGVIPGLTLSTGGAYQAAADTWLSFAPNGDLYFSCLGISAQATNGGHISYSATAVLTEKSTDGGLTWSAPITLVQSTTATTFNDKDSVTADPTTPGYAYVVWSQLTSSGGPEMLTRTTDGGQSWSTPSTIFDPGGGTDADPTQIVVSPDGTLIDFMDFGRYQNSKKIQTLSLIRSSDKGQTWLPADNPIQVGNMLSIGVTDPDTGQPVDTPGGINGVFSVAGDPHNGNLYAVWQDARFSNSQYDGIAFSMSTDGGLTWSAPIQVNQTPTNIPAGDRQAFLPSVAVAADGSVAVTYYDFRFNDANPGLLTDYWLVEGRAGTDLTNPASWRNEARLTNQSFDLEQAGVWAGRGFFLGDYVGLAAAGNSFDAFFPMTNGTDPGDIYFRDPVAAASTPVPALMNAATAATDPAAPLSSEPLGKGLVVDALFTDLTRTSQATSGVSNGDTAPANTVGLAPPALPGTTEQVVPPSAAVPGTPTSAVARWAGYERVGDGGADDLTSADPSWDGEAATWPAR
jgi:hypothetical protein